PRGVLRSGLERGSGLGGVLGAAVVGDLAVAEREVVVQVHGGGLAGGPDPPRNRTTDSTSVSLAAMETGVNSSTSMVEPNSAKNAATPSLPCLTPYHGAAAPAASAAQSTSSVTASRMAATSPRPK